MGSVTRPETVTSLNATLYGIGRSRTATNTTPTHTSGRNQRRRCGAAPRRADHHTGQQQDPHRDTGDDGEGGALPHARPGGQPHDEQRRDHHVEDVGREPGVPVRGPPGDRRSAAGGRQEARAPDVRAHVATGGGRVAQQQPRVQRQEHQKAARRARSASETQSAPVRLVCVSLDVLVVEHPSSAPRRQQCRSSDVGVAPGPVVGRVGGGTLVEGFGRGDLVGQGRLAVRPPLRVRSSMDTTSWHGHRSTMASARRRPLRATGAGAQPDSERR